MDKSLRIILDMGADYLELPADEYDLVDCADRLHNPNGILFTILAMPSNVHYDRVSKGGLAELNLLSEKLAAMDCWQQDAFIGLTAMSDSHPDAPALINLAMNADKCQVLYEVGNHEELGRFYVDNDIYELPNGTPESLYDYLDYEKIGYECRQKEGGIFLDNCYVLNLEPIEQLYDGHPPELARPSAPFLLTLGLGPPAEGDPTVTLELPATDKQIKAVLEQIDSCCPEECVCHRLVGVLPQAEAWLEDMGGFDTLNQLAANVKDIVERNELPLYKAMLEATECADLETALLLSTQTEDYILTADMITFEDVAVGELNFMLNSDDAEGLIPFVDLPSFGKQVLKNCNAILTDYGQINRVDYQPMQAPAIEPEQDMNQQMMT